MEIIKPLYTFAQSYDCSSYGAGNFGENQVCTTGQPAGQDASTLPATGENLIIGVGTGLVLITAAVVMLTRLRKKHSNRQD